MPKYGPQIVTDGLVLCLDAASTKSYPGSGSTWYDLSTSKNNATFTNGPTFSSSNLGYVNLDGSNDTINFSYDLRQNFTFLCWVKHDVVNGFSFLGQGTGTTRGGLHIWFRAANYLRFGMFANDTDTYSISTSINRWYYYGFTYNHSNYQKKIFRDGISLSVQNMHTQNSYVGTGTIRIGATYSSGGAYANGQFAVNKLYNRVLEPAEILQNYNATKGRYGL